MIEFVFTFGGSEGQGVCDGEISGHQYGETMVFLEESTMSFLTSKLAIVGLEGLSKPRAF